MKKRGAGKCGGFAAAAIALVLLLASCGQSPGPAPVVATAPQPMTITIARGQTLSGIAQVYRVPMHVLAEVNHLSPPYRILAGAALVIPTARAPAAGVVPPPPAVAALQPAAPAPPPTSVSAATAPAREIVRSAARPPPERTVPAARATAPVPAPQPMAASPPEAAVPAKPAARPAAIATETAPVRGGATFLWPVHGRIVEGFGAGPDGTHNDGINIAAPRGSPVQAVDGGVVAYTGNELRGYGNLILIKHPNGWITAYAHCDLILVKRGQKVARGQVIARVGSTGNVSTPQLHFELRRGDKPVDPRTHLSPLPSAAAAPTSRG